MGRHYFGGIRTATAGEFLEARANHCGSTEAGLGASNCEQIVVVGPGATTGDGEATESSLHGQDRRRYSCVGPAAAVLLVLSAAEPKVCCYPCCSRQC